MAVRQNILDRVIGYFSPVAAADRVKARGVIETVTRGYAGAAVGRHTDGWKASSTSADTEIWVGGRRLRDRARDLERNNPYAAKAASILTTNIVGEGIMPRANTGDDARDKRVMAAFDKWSKECDADGQLDFYGLQTLAVRGMVVGGEMLSRRRRRSAEDGMSVPLQIQLMEPDFLDDMRHGDMIGGFKAVQGVEFDVIGRRAAYWLFRDHPGNNFTYRTISYRVPATEIAHIYEKQRTQSRGVSWFAPVIRRIRDVDDYDFAEGIRKKIEASTVAFVTGEDEELAISPEGDRKPMRVEDANGNLIEKFAPGLIAYLRGGKDVKFNAPASVGGYENYKRVTAREIASGARVPYALLTGDGSQENFSAQRYLLTEFRRFCGVIQWQLVIPMLLEPWWRWFCEAAYAAGEIDEPYIPVEWSPPKWHAIDPYKDALSDVLNLRMGLKSWPEAVSSGGRNPEDVFSEIVTWNKKFDDAGAVFDGDPRKVSLAGVMQKLVTDAATGGDNQGGGQPQG